MADLAEEGEPVEKAIVPRRGVTVTMLARRSGRILIGSERPLSLFDASDRRSLRRRSCPKGCLINKDCLRHHGGAGDSYWRLHSRGCCYWRW